MKSAAITAASLAVLTGGCAIGDRLVDRLVPDSSLRSVVVVPFDVADLTPDQRWMGEGVAHLVAFGLRHHSGLVHVARGRVHAARGADSWSETVVRRVAQDVRADVAIYGRISRTDSALLIQPLLVDVRRRETISLPPVATLDGELETRVMPLPASYVRALGLTMTDSEAWRMERAARATRRLRALELFTRGHSEFDREADERAVEVLSEAIRHDPNFVMAQYTLGLVHMKLGNRWKAAAQLLAASKLDPTMPEPLKSLGDLYLAQPNQLFGQAIEAYARAIALRRWYADAHVGIGDAFLMKENLDAAVAAYREATTFDPFNSRTQLKLAQVFASTGRCADASIAYRKAMQLDPAAKEVPAPCRPRTDR